MTTSIASPTLKRDEFLNDYFGGKKITLMGLGLLGRGIGDAKFLAAYGANLIITDLKTETELAPSIAALAEFPEITYHLGGHRLEDFENRDLIIKAPNTPLDSPFIAHAREKNIPIEMDAALFVKLITEFYAPADRPLIIGVTGTRGKSTTTHLLYQMAHAAFVNRRVYLGGNVRDIATLPLIDAITEHDAIVLELDSWQLQGFESDHISPNISIWTNFMSDHMNYYRGNMDRYFQDKAAIARFQDAEDFFIAPRDIKEQIEKRFGALSGKYIEPTAVPADWEIALPGEHNSANAACAIAAARAAGISDEIIKKVLKEFLALPGRLEFIGEKNGIAFYNDSNSTTPDALIAALQAMISQQKPIILIGGGSDKELDFKSLGDEMLKDAASIKRVILFKGKATDKILPLIPDSTESVVVSTMTEAMEVATAIATSGDVVLFSPGATSFGIFKNEYDRGDQFVAAFKAL